MSETLGEKKKLTTCCKNTVNSTAECAGEKLATSRSLQLLSHPAKSRLQRRPLVTFVLKAALLESGVGGSEGKRPRLSSTAVVCIKNVPKIAHSHAQPTGLSPFCLPENTSFSSRLKTSSMIVSERSVFTREASYTLLLL